VCVFDVTTAADGAETIVPDLPSSWHDTQDAFKGTRAQTFVSYANNSLSYDRNRLAGSSWYHKPRGTWILKELYALEGTAKRKPKVTDTVVYATYTVTEPLLLSPFVFGHPEGKQGFYGIQTMNFQMNMSPTANRAWRSVKQLTNEAAYWGGGGAIAADILLQGGGRGEVHGLQAHLHVPDATRL
jgi:hypothetical protein